jgi:hypothetical protein
MPCSRNESTPESGNKNQRTDIGGQKSVNGVSFRLIRGALPVNYCVFMSAAEIIAELPKLTLEERRRLAGAIFDLETEADLLRDCDRRADERFSGLDAMESEDVPTSAG